MPQRILSEATASISELKAAPMDVIASVPDEVIAILNRNKPAFYCIPPKLYEAIMEMLDDMELLRIIEERKDEKPIPVKLSDL